MLQRHGKPAEALPLARKALTHSYGDNRLRVGLLTAQLLVEAHQNNEARNVAERILASAKEPSDAQNRTHRYLKQLRELRDKLAGN